MAASLLQLNKLLAVVTGGGNGIGRAICQRFAREGASVAVVDINGAQAEITLKGLDMVNESKHSAYATDVSSAASVKQLMDNIRSQHTQTPSILVHSAGINKDSFLVKMDEKNFDDVIAVNLKGTFLMTQAITKVMVENKEQGSIITISSMSGRVGNLGQCNYSASKAGVEGFIKTVAKELARHNIRCNTVVPGWIQETSMVNAVPEKVINKVLGMVPLGRLGQPEDVADVCLFLASHQSSYITGTSIEVTGGLFM